MDIYELKWRTTGINVSCPQILISAKFVNSNNQSQVLDDRTEASGKQVLFPNIVASLTAAERDYLVEKIAWTLTEIYMRRIQE
jgi:hypothetical protein